MDRQLSDNMMTWAFLLFMLTQVFCQLCETPCRCPSTAPQCPTNVSLALDSCGCCHICARQLGEQCTNALPCDSQKGLQCDTSGSLPGEPGECVSQEQLDCELNGATYRNGQAFQPSCKITCRCQQGGVTCVPACPNDIRLPSPDCPNPQHVLLPGKCCKEWLCENLENTVLQDAITAHWLWPSFSGTHHANRLVPHPSTCTERSTQWTACSQSCGAGVSTRVSNKNPACRLEMQTRLCKVRPCEAVQLPLRTPKWEQHGHCWASYRSRVPIRLVHQGCYSTGVYRLRYCGQCTDSRCCTPHHTHTTEVPFRCPTGRLLQRAVMMIHSCVCHMNCPPTHTRSAGSTHSNPAFWWP